MKFTAADIAQRLATDVRGACRHLLPQGREVAHEWLAGSVSGEAGDSLKVRLDGPKAGRWSDFANDTDRGDLLDLWAATRSVSLGDALREACEHLGIERPRLEQERRPATLAAPKGSRAVPDESPVMVWLAKRGFSAETVRKFRVAEHKGAVLFPAFSPAGTIQYAKYRSVTEKKFWSEAGGVPCLFGWQAMPPDVRACILAEGESDAVAWAEYGMPALSPTNGAANASWIETEFDNLARFDCIFISYDMDEAGQAHVAEVAERLGRERCRIVSLPHKDANECLLRGVTEAQMRQALREAKTMDPEALISAASLEDALIAYRESGRGDSGVPLPFAFDEDLFRIRAGELVILAGYSGSGKTEMANQLTLHALMQGHRACIGSFEFRPVKLMDRIQRQAGAVAEMAEQYSRAISRWCEDRLWLFVPVGAANTSRLLDVFEYAVRRYNIRWFVVDNLAKCGIGEEDYDRQKRFVERLAEFARDNDASVL
ncbi:MAG: AAA family ATPase, partial [Salinisphaera sp.]|nr:AAA family ATPase [Salinisphaera sp.]